MYIYSNTAAKLLFVESEIPLTNHDIPGNQRYQILDQTGQMVVCPELSCVQKEEKFVTTLDAGNLKSWSPDSPVLYTLKTKQENVDFGYMSLRTFQNKSILLNDAPVYLRGYIRGIPAHDHPNMGSVK